MIATETSVCYRCGAPAQIDHAKSKPGITRYCEIHYQPCRACGHIGTRREGDLYQEIHRKKSNVAPYDKSPYRGGRL